MSRPIICGLCDLMSQISGFVYSFHPGTIEKIDEIMTVHSNSFSLLGRNPNCGDTASTLCNKFTGSLGFGTDEYNSQHKDSYYS